MPVALIHTHGRFDANTENYKDAFSHPGNVLSGNDEFSDTYQSDAIGIDYYLVTPNGKLKKYISNGGNVEGILISSNMPVDPRIKVYEIKKVKWLRGTTISAYGMAKAGMLVIKFDKKKIVRLRNHSNM